MSSTQRSSTVVTTPTPIPTSIQGTTSSSSQSSSSSSTSTSSTSTDSSSTSSSASPTTPSSVLSTTPTPTTPTPTTPTPTTPQSTPSTSPVEQSTSPTSVGATTPTSSPASTPTSTSFTTTTSSFTTSLPTTIVTSSDGSIITITTIAPAVVTTTISSPVTTGNSSSNSHIGVIVGAAVGGVGGIAILILLLLCIRRRNRKDEFDGDFDPDRVIGHTGGGGTLPPVDLADEVTPYPHPYAADGENSTMRQFGGSSYFAVPSPFATNGQNSTEFYPSSKAAAVGVADPQSRMFGPPHVGSPPPGGYMPPTDMYGAGSIGWSDPRTSPPPSTTSQTTSSARGAKEREAMGRDGQGTGLGLATQQEVAEGSEDVVVHQDAGRAPVEDHAPPREIPPSYESIQHD